MDRIRDRGIIKWQGLMIPEHVRMIKEWEEANDKVEKPQLDDWELEAIQMEMELAYKRGSSASVKVWRNGMTQSYNGKITELNASQGYVSIDSPFGDDRIPVEDIIRVDSMY